MCHEDCEENGSIFECGGGVYQKVQLARGEGKAFDLSKADPSVEDIAEAWDEITDMDKAEVIDFQDGGSKDGIQNVMKLASNL